MERLIQKTGNYKTTCEMHYAFHSHQWPLAPNHFGAPEQLHCQFNPHAKRSPPYPLKLGNIICNVGGGWVRVGGGSRGSYAKSALKQNSGKFALQSYLHLGHVQRHDVIWSLGPLHILLQAERPEAVGLVAKFAKC